MRFQRVAISVLLVAGFMVIGLAAHACSIAGPLPLRLALEEELMGRNDGIYEQLTIARAPGILIRDKATASVVTRYWGRPPANLGVQYEGGDWFSWVNLPWWNVDSCEGLVDDEGRVLTPDGVVGTIGFGHAPSPENATGPLSPEEAAVQGTVPWHRSAPLLPLEDGDVVGSLSVEELDLLEATYGPATEVDTPISTYIWATIIVWWPTVVGLAIVASLIAVIISRILIGRSRDRTESPSSVNV